MCDAKYTESFSDINTLNVSVLLILTCSNLPQTLRMFSLKTLEKEHALRTHVYGRLVIELICINYFLLIIQGF